MDRATQSLPAGPPRSPLTVWVIVAFLAVAGVAASARLASAHARLARSSPANDTVLALPPTQIDLWFNELLDESFHRVSLFPAASADDLAGRRSLIADAPAVDPADRTHLHAPVPAPALAPGEYVVEWQVLSRDGHSARGRVRFRVKPQP